MYINTSMKLTTTDWNKKSFIIQLDLFTDNVKLVVFFQQGL